MLVIAHHFPKAQVVMVMFVLVVLHTLHGLLLQQIHAVDHPQGLALGLHRLQNRLHPGVRLTPQVNEQVALLDRQNIGWSGLVGVALGPRRQQ